MHQPDKHGKDNDMTCAELLASDPHGQSAGLVWLLWPDGRQAVMPRDLVHVRGALAAEHSRLSPTLVFAVGAVESDYVWREGALGEVGYWQLKMLDSKGGPSATARECADLDVYEPGGNARCAVRMLERAVAACGSTPLVFLGRYNGTRECLVTPYAKKVVARWAAGFPRTGTVAGLP